MFYTPLPPENNFLLLTGSEALHCVRVLRHMPGDRIEITDGAGSLFETRIAEINTKAKVPTVICEIRAGTFTPAEPNKEIHLIFPYLKSSETFDFALEKAVELGTTHFYFTPTRRSERSRLKPERIDKIILSSLKQCLRLHLPETFYPKDFSESLKLVSNIKNKFIAFCPEKNAYFQPIYPEIEPAAIAVGPEGDFTDEEIWDALAAGFQTVSLGRERLRSETAVIYMLSVLKACRKI